jgi:putative phosphoesterase
MTRIGLLSDTHAFLHPRIFEHFKDCDQIWHAGDFGNISIADELSKFKTLVGVYGNIDGQDIRISFPKDQKFMCEKVSVWMTHIGGYPGRYEKGIKEQLIKQTPKLFISGHSHILKVMNDKKLHLLHINPGAAGKYGFQLVKTLVRFSIDEDRILDLDVIELS